MRQDEIKRFFELYLEVHSLDYKKKSDVYTVKLDKEHKKLLDRDTLVCTLDETLAQKMNIEHITNGKSVFTTLLSSYIDFHASSSLHLESHKEDLNEVNEKLSELNEKGNYLIEEKREIMTYMLFEVCLKIIQGTTTLTQSVLFSSTFTCNANGIEECQFTDAHKEVDIFVPKNINAFIEKELQKEIQEAEHSHDQQVKALLEIQQQHAEDKHKELDREEDKLRYKIQEAREGALSAISFDSKNNWQIKEKTLQRKLEKLVASNQKKRERIHKELQDEKQIIMQKEAHMTLKLQAFAEIDMPYFTVKYSSKTYTYLPCLHKFVN